MIILNNLGLGLIQLGLSNRKHDSLLFSSWSS
uniref:Uncharacterized protein n=1 Tax=Arundo donax TaxID=35708 RepID=A0A0A8ZQT7_ARUDO